MAIYMLENKIKQIKKIEPKKIIYPAILIAYFGLIVLFLFFSLQFFTKQLNLILAADEESANAQNQPALDKAGYRLLEKKFNLTPYVAEQAPVAAELQVIATTTGSTTPILDATSTAVRIDSTTTAPLTISVLNSTRTPGLAGKFKGIFEAAGWPIAKIGNYSPVLATTTINISPQLANDSGWTTIKSVLTENGLLYIENLLPVAGSYDLEIIIGNH